MKAAQSITMDILQNFALFEGVEPELLTQLAAQAETLKVGRQQLIYEVGDRSDSVFFLAKGVVKIGTHSEDGREVIKQVLHPLALFGELCLAGEHTRKEFAATMNEEVQLIAIRVQCLQQLMRQNHHLALRALHFIGSRLRRAENRLESLMFKDARERIIEFLRESATIRGKRIGFEMLIKHSLTQQDIANITGTSRQTVTSVLNELKKSNLIHFNRRSILIRDLAKLA